MDTFDQLTANRRHNPQNSSSAQSWQCNRSNTQRGKPSQQQQPSQGPDNAKMERMKHISAAQNELYDRILTQYYMPLQLYIKAKDPKTVTLAEHTRLYKLGKLMETLSLSCQVQNKIVSWYSSVSGNLTNDFNNSLQRTLDDMEKATTAIDDHWSCKGVSPEADPTSFTEKLGLDPIKSKSAGSSTLLAVDMTTIEDRITNLHTSLESALNSLKRMIHTAQTEHVPLSNLDLSESDLGMLLLTLPLPYGGQEGWIAAK